MYTFNDFKRVFDGTWHSWIWYFQFHTSVIWWIRKKNILPNQAGSGEGRGARGDFAVSRPNRYPLLPNTVGPGWRLHLQLRACPAKHDTTIGVISDRSVSKYIKYISFTSALNQEQLNYNLVLDIRTASTLRICLFTIDGQESPSVK